MAKLTPTYDLDLEDVQELYKDAKETIAYLADLCQSIDNRVLKGEEIEGFKIVNGRKSQVITEPGKKYLESILGKEECYKVTKKFIGITELKTMLSGEEMIELHKKGALGYSVPSKKVVVD